MSILKLKFDFDGQNIPKPKVEMAETSLGWYMPIKRQIAKRLENGARVSYCEIGLNKNFNVYEIQFTRFQYSFQDSRMLRKSPRENREIERSTNVIPKKNRSNRNIEIVNRNRLSWKFASSPSIWIQLVESVLVYL